MNTGRLSVAIRLAPALFAFLSAGMAGAACDFELDATDRRETKMLTVARGMNTGLAAHLGVFQGDYYLKGRFFSQFTATPEFTQDHPLELTLDDGTILRLAVIQGGTGKWDPHPMLVNNREAQPRFAVSAEQARQLIERRIVHLRITHLAEGRLRVREYEVKTKHAARLAEGMRCIAG